ncbi:MAG: pyruvate kinase alpha/beta domain-containing protein [Solirubrobacteraceae bacterium]
MVLETSWATGVGWIIVRDVLLIGGWHHETERSNTHRRAPTDYDADHVLLRTVRCVNGEVEVALDCEPAFDYGRVRTRWEYAGADYHEGVARSPEQGIELKLRTDMRLGFEGPRATARHRMKEGEQLYCALAWSEHAQLAQAAEESPVIQGRARPGEPDSPAGAVMYAAVELAEALDAIALIVPTTRGGSPRACAKYRRRRPIVALPVDDRVTNQLTLEWGVYPFTMAVTGSVDELIEAALVKSKESAGLPSGARVVLTAGRRTGSSGATNLITVREIP